MLPPDLALAGSPVADRCVSRRNGRAAAPPAPSRRPSRRRTHPHGGASRRHPACWPGRRGPRLQASLWRPLLAYDKDEHCRTNWTRGGLVCTATTTRRDLIRPHSARHETETDESRRPTARCLLFEACLAEARAKQFGRVVGAATAADSLPSSAHSHRGRAAIAFGGVAASAVVALLTFPEVDGRLCVLISAFMFVVPLAAALWRGDHERVHDLLRARTDRYGADREDCLSRAGGSRGPVRCVVGRSDCFLVAGRRPSVETLAGSSLPTLP